MVLLLQVYNYFRKTFPDKIMYSDILWRPLQLAKVMYYGYYGSISKGTFCSCWDIAHTPTAESQFEITNSPTGENWTIKISEILEDISCWMTFLGKFASHSSISSWGPNHFRQKQNGWVVQDMVVIILRPDGQTCIWIGVETIKTLITRQLNATRISHPGDCSIAVIGSSKRKSLLT